MRPDPQQRHPRRRTRTISTLLAAAVVGASLAQADILRSATSAQDPLCTAGRTCTEGQGIFAVVDKLLDPALWIVVALAPLAMAWGGGMLMFGGKHGPQIMGGAIVAIVLVASAKGIAA